MTCVEFEKILLDLSRGRAESPESLAHAASCAHCARRLREQRVLSRSLRALAAESQGLEAPERVEAALRSAWRARQAPTVARMPRRLLWAATIAAAISMVVGIALWRRETALRARPQLAVAPVAAARPASEAAPQEPKMKHPARQAPKSAPKLARAGTPRRAPAGRRPGRVPARSEVTTGFVALQPGPALNPGESGRLVRVRLPRTTLVSFGLPVNFEQPGDAVQADVLFGEDGVARAIRFVNFKSY
jgi:hypothetical protein